MQDGQIADQTAAELVPRSSIAVTLSADFDLTSHFVSGYCRELYIGTGGTVVAQLVGDSATQTYVNLPNGSFLHGYFTIVKSTGHGTTASNIIARR
jgi:hypothetical protein